MHIFLIAALLLMTSCATTYEAARQIDGAETTLSVRSYREFEGGIKIRYDRETGTFELEAGKVNSDDQTAAALLGILPLLRPGVQ